MVTVYITGKTLGKKLLAVGGGYFFLLAEPHFQVYYTTSLVVIGSEF